MSFCCRSRKPLVVLFESAKIHWSFFSRWQNPLQIKMTKHSTQIQCSDLQLRNLYPKLEMLVTGNQTSLKITNTFLKSCCAVCRNQGGSLVQALQPWTVHFALLSGIILRFHARPVRVFEMSAQNLIELRLWFKQCRWWKWCERQVPCWNSYESVSISTPAMVCGIGNEFPCVTWYMPDNNVPLAIPISSHPFCY